MHGLLITVHAWHIGIDYYDGMRNVKLLPSHGFVNSHKAGHLASAGTRVSWI